MNTRTLLLPRRVITLVAAGGLATTGAAALATGWTASATPGETHQVWVCKYHGLPEQGDLLKGGQNPMFVDVASLDKTGTMPKIGDRFMEGENYLVVVQIDGSDPGIAACGVVVPTTTVPATTDAPTTTAPATTDVPTTTAPATTDAPTTTTPATTDVPTTTTPTTTVPGGDGGGDGDGGSTTTAPPTTTSAPTTTDVPTTDVPTTDVPTTDVPTTDVPTTDVPTTTVPTTTTVVPTSTAPTTVVVPAPTKPAHPGGGGSAVGNAATGSVPGAGAPHTGGAGEVSSTNRFLGSGLLAGGLALAVTEAVRRRRENKAS